MTNLPVPRCGFFKDSPNRAAGESRAGALNEKRRVARDGHSGKLFMSPKLLGDKPMIHIYGHTWPVAG